MKVKLLALLTEPMLLPSMEEIKSLYSAAL